ncbi:carbon-nitrogen hydrolase [Aspergillus similis]
MCLQPKPLVLLALLAVAIASPVRNASSPVLKAALIRAPPALWTWPIPDREYPWHNTDTWLTQWGESYAENSITVNDTNWNRLLSAAQANAIYVAIGFSERQGDYIYMAQALFSPKRDIWSDGTMKELHVVETKYGRIGLLECWEHFHPAMTFPMAVQAEDIHIAGWPYMPDYGSTALGAEPYETAELNMAAASVYATNSGAWTLVSVVGRAAAVDTTGFGGGVPYAIDGEQSWVSWRRLGRDGRFPGDILIVDDL